MAIIFTTGTINAPDAGSVGLAMAEKIRDDFVAHPAWELVEEYVPAGITPATWYVFKCLAVESGLPADFFVILQRMHSDGSIRASICEGYDSATHVASLFGTWSTGTSQLYDASGRLPITYVLVSGQMSITGASPKHSGWAPSGVSTKWWLAVAEDGFTVAFNGAANGFWHFGAYIPLSNLSNVMPLQMIDGSDTRGAVTRNPAVASSSAKQSALVVYGGGAINFTGTYLGFVGRLDIDDKLMGNQRPVAEVGIQTDDASGFADRASHGWVLGKQKRMRAGLNPPAGFAFGDAYVFQGRLWVPYLPTDTRLWDTGVAA